MYNCMCNKKIVKLRPRDLLKSHWTLLIIFTFIMQSFYVFMQTEKVLKNTSKVLLALVSLLAFTHSSYMQFEDSPFPLPKLHNSVTVTSTCDAAMWQNFNSIFKRSAKVWQFSKIPNGVADPSVYIKHIAKYHKSWFLATNCCRHKFCRFCWRHVCLLVIMIINITL